MAEKKTAEVRCPQCSGHDVQVLHRKSNLRQRLQTGNLRTDLTPISTTATYKCQGCGHEWSELAPV